MTRWTASFTNDSIKWFNMRSDNISLAKISPNIHDIHDTKHWSKELLRLFWEIYHRYRKDIMSLDVLCTVKVTTWFLTWRKYCFLLWEFVFTWVQHELFITLVKVIYSIVWAQYRVLFETHGGTILFESIHLIRFCVRSLFPHISNWFTIEIHKNIHLDHALQKKFKQYPDLANFKTRGLLSDLLRFFFPSVFTSNLSFYCFCFSLANTIPPTA